MANKSSLIALFENGDVPQGTDFQNLINSNLNLDETGTQTLAGSLSATGGVSGTTLAASTRLSIGVQSLAGVGTVQGTAAQITSSYVVATNTVGNTAYLLPSVVGSVVIFRNSGANTALIFPPTGAQIDALGTNASLSVTSGNKTMIVCESATQYASFAV
jgi:hypothetical protein